MRQLTSLIAVVGLTAAACSSLAGNEGGGSDSIRKQDLTDHVGYLAADGMRGRDTGSAEVAKAEEYVAARFKTIGLAPVPGSEDFFLDFTLYRTGYDLEATALAVEAGESSVTAAPGEGFRPFPFSAAGSTEGEVVFAGYGITAPEHDYDDYAGLDVKDKLVLVLRHEPGENDPDSPFDGASSSQYALFASKAQNAAEHGASGMLLVTDPLNHTDDADDLRVGGGMRLERAGRDFRGGGFGSASLLAAQIGRGLAETIAAGSGRSLSELQRALDEGTPAAELPAIGARASLSITPAKQAEEVPARDVAGFLPGSDPELKDEWIVIGGHHDHVGAYHGEGDTVFNGADDNASGTAGVLELAEAFARRERKPRRSIVFVTFSGEEKGLLGSRALLADNLIPPERVVFMLNLDMIGRNPDRAVEVFGDGFVSGLRDVVESARDDGGPELEYGGTSYAANSDHHPFYERDIPFMFFFTGLHEDYHQLGDHIDKLSYGRMQQILRLAYDVIDRLADADTRPMFVHNIDWLGLRVEVVSDDEGRAAAVVTAVDRGSRGEQAGVQAGDVIAAFDKDPLTDPADVGREFRSIDPGDKLALTLERSGEPQVVKVERARTGYLGVMPAPVDDDLRKRHGLREDQGILLGTVMPDGPSAKGGLQQGDVVLSIAGQPVGVGSLRSVLVRIGAGETVEVQLIRDGERKSVEVTLGRRPDRR